MKPAEYLKQQIEASVLTRKEWYRQVYLKSDHWSAVRAKALASSSFCCRGCSCGSKLQVHHLTYDNLGSERLDDLMVLCDRCHGLAHELLREMRKTLDTTTHRKVLSHFLYYATTPKADRTSRKKAKKNHNFNKLPAAIRNLVSKAKKALSREQQ